MPLVPLRMLALCPLLLLGACSAQTAESQRTTQPADWDAELRLPEAVDEDPDPHVFETTLIAKVVNLELVPGKLTAVWTYNGVLPGPLIRVRQGDRLRVHLKNELPEATTIHWHGIRLPNAMDGVPGDTQPAVEPGGSFDYDFVLPDAGTFWYHPHADSAAQVGYGLYGPLLVDDPSEPAELGDELVLVLSDMLLDPRGSGQQQPADAGGDLETLFGREGDTLLVNGKLNPTLRPRAGRRQRWRLINAAKTRYYQLALQGQSFTRIGGDDGLSAAPQELDRVVLTPGQRADVMLELAMPSASTLPVRWVPYDRGYGSVEYRSEETLFTLQTSALAAESSPARPVVSRELAAVDITQATAQRIELTQSPAGTPFSLGINGVPGAEAQPIQVSVGDTQLWTVHNNVPWAHPFHVHGFFFQVLDVNGVPPPVLEWRDTVDVPVDATVRLAIQFNERPGMWMFHCHILDHADAGMMGMVHLHAH